jgi:hypothetical protein
LSKSPLSLAQPPLSLHDVILPLLHTAGPAQLRGIADNLDREAALLRARARDLERAEAERQRRRQRRAERDKALDELRRVGRAGGNLPAAVQAAAARIGADPSALLAMHRADARRWSAAERARRDRVIVQLAVAGYHDHQIAELIGLSRRRTSQIVAAGLAARRQLQPIAVRRTVGGA